MPDLRYAAPIQLLYTVLIDPITTGELTLVVTVVTPNWPKLLLPNDDAVGKFTQPEKLLIWTKLEVISEPDRLNGITYSPVF